MDASGHMFDQQYLYNFLFHAEVTMPHKEQILTANFIGSAMEPGGFFVGAHDNNPMLNNLMY